MFGDYKVLMNTQHILSAQPQLLIQWQFRVGCTLLLLVSKPVHGNSNCSGILFLQRHRTKLCARQDINTYMCTNAGCANIQRPYNA